MRVEIHLTSINQRYHKLINLFSNQQIIFWILLVKKYQFKHFNAIFDQRNSHDEILIVNVLNFQSFCKALLSANIFDLSIC